MGLCSSVCVHISCGATRCTPVPSLSSLSYNTLKQRTYTEKRLPRKLNTTNSTFGLDVVPNPIDFLAISASIHFEHRFFVQQCKEHARNVVWSRASVEKKLSMHKYSGSWVFDLSCFNPRLAKFPLTQNDAFSFQRTRPCFKFQVSVTVARNDL